MNFMLCNSTHLWETFSLLFLPLLLFLLHIEFFSKNAELECALLQVSFDNKQCLQELVFGFSFLKNASLYFVILH